MVEEKIQSNNAVLLDRRVREKINVKPGERVEIYAVNGGLFVTKKETPVEIMISSLDALKEDIERKQKLEHKEESKKTGHYTVKK